MHACMYAFMAIAGLALKTLFRMQGTSVAML